MSKRHGATSVEQYRNLGYLPEALVNFLALLGWSPEGEEEIFTRQQLVEKFSLDRVAKNPAVFDVDKLNWLNSHYLRELSPVVLTELCLPHLIKAGYVPGEIDEDQRNWLIAMVGAVQEYLSCAAQVVDHVAVFFTENIVVDEEGKEVLRDPEIPQVFAAFAGKLAALETIEEQAVQAILKAITKELKVGGKKVYMPIRIALSGQAHGLDLLKLIVLLGKERVLARIDAAGKLL